MPQFQVKKDNLNNSRLVDTTTPECPVDGIVATVDSFAFTSNNITYGVAGDKLGYWQFFPPVQDNGETWGVLPVWGYAEVTDSQCADIETGERLFGYFPPATHVCLQPVNLKPVSLHDGTPHRNALPAAYNRYRRVSHEPGYDSSMDAHQSLLLPLFITSYLLADYLQQQQWFGAEQVIILSASSKTALGLGYALDSVSTLGMTSARHRTAISGLNIYDQCMSYDDAAMIEPVPSVIVDMAGNSALLGTLHRVLGDNMKRTLNVGITHWSEPRNSADITRDRCEMFFAPAQIERRVKDSGPQAFEQQSGAFLKAAIAHSGTWLRVERLQGLTALQATYPDICNGSLPADSGLIIEL
jgi:hypothetical protein